MFPATKSIIAATLPNANFQLPNLTMRRFCFRFLIALSFLLALAQLADLNRPLTQVVLSAQTPTQTSVRGQQLDLLILHGKLVDGSGKKPRTADVGIRGDRIAFVGDASKAHLTAKRTIDATG